MLRLERVDLMHVTLERFDAASLAEVCVAVEHRLSLRMQSNQTIVELI